MFVFRLASLCVLFLASVSPAYADTKTLTADASYIMGDGETPVFAEARALQKAKQTALEEAGTYVQSYTKVQNLDLTTEEIQTIAGGVLQVEVLEKTRSLVSDGLRFYTKIKATVTTEKMEELARRIKGKNVAEEYTKLQSEYARLSRELESWKQRAAQTTQGPERNAALDQIREQEKDFARVQQSEAALFRRLVSGQQLAEQASRDKDIIDRLLETILTSGYIVTVGDMQAAAASGRPDQLVLRVPLTIQVSKTLLKAVSHAANVLGGSVQPDFQTFVFGPGNRQHATVTLVRLANNFDSEGYFQRGVWRIGLQLRFQDGTNSPNHCLLYDKKRDSVQNEDWRRISAFSRPSWLRSEATRKSTSSRLGVFYEYSDEYVAIDGDEAQVVVEHRLPAQSVRNLTGVSVRAIAVTDGLALLAPRCAISQ